MNELVIAAVRCDEEFVIALKSNVSIIFYLNPNIMDIEKQIKESHKVGKKIFVHIDLAEGIGKDKFGIAFLKNLGVDGIISTRVNIIRAAKELGLFTVQRFFIVDSHSVDTTIEALHSSKADMIEIMPGIATKVIKRLKQELNIPVIAGGLIESEREIISAIESGATSVSTGKKEFWVSLGE